VWILLWIIPGILSTLPSVFLSQGYENVGRDLTHQIPPWLLVWAPATPLVRRWVERRAWVRVALLAPVVVVLQTIVFVTLGRLLGVGYFVDHPPLEAVSVVSIKLLPGGLLTYAGLTAALFALAQRRERAALEAQLARAQLDALRAQIHPHFLFNTLNAVSVLVRKQDTAAALATIEALAGLLRAAIDTREPELPLERELGLLRAYLDIACTRFSDRLTVKIDVEPGLEDARVPALVLQPLVENALRHGLAPRPGPGSLTVAVRRAGDRLRLAVEDDGVGMSGASPGTGLSNVRARMEALYPGAHRFTVENVDPGVRATVEIPFRRA